MSKTITLEGTAALAVQSMIAEARAKWPTLNGATDEEALTILVGFALTKEVRAWRSRYPTPNLRL